MNNSILKCLFKTIGLLAIAALSLTGCSRSEDWDSFVYPPAGDRSALEEIVSECSSLVAGATIGNKEGQYLQYVVDNLNSAIDGAKTVLTNDKATQAMVDNAVSDLEEAKKIFLESVNVGDLDDNDSNLVLHLRFSGNVYDGSAYGHSVKKNAGSALCGNGAEPSFTTDRHGNENAAMHFEKGGYLSIPYVSGKSESLNPGVMTFMCWIREPSPAKCQRWLFCLDTWNIFYVVLPEGGREFQFAGCTTRGWLEMAHSGFESSASWQHIAVTYSTDIICFYRNGELVSSVESNGGNLVNNNAKKPFLIGLMDPDRELYFEGDMDEFRLYDTVLSEKEIYSVFALEKPSTMEIDRSPLADAISRANTVLDNASVGFKAGQWLQSEVDGLKQHISGAESVLSDKVATQNQVENAAKALNGQIEDFLSSVNGRDYDPNIVLSLNCDGDFKDESYLAHRFEMVKGTSGLPPYPAIDRYGNYDGALHFDNGSYISIPFSESLSSPELTYMFWIKAATPAGKGDPYLMSINRRFHFYVGLKGNSIMLGGQNAKSNLGETVTEYAVGDEWKHIAVTYSAAEGAVVYVNGAEAARVAAEGDLNPVTNSTPFVIGVKGSTDSKNSYFKGDLDEILVYDRPLTASEVSEIYNAQK